MKVFYQLVDDVNWFFFDYFILGYVENTSADSTSPDCLSLPLVAGVSMSVYVEVCCRCDNHIFQRNILSWIA